MTPIEKSYGGNTIGQFYEFQGGVVFFGNKGATLETLRKAFPDYEWIFIRQVHGNHIAEARFNQEVDQEGDAHWTKEKNKALCIRTADCIPVFIKPEHAPTIMAVHAGWRGIESRIIVKAVELLTSPQSLQAYVGPHILCENFEVDLTVAERLVHVSGPGDEISFPHNNPNKKFVDLLRIVRFQLKSTRPPIIFSKNTFNNPEYHSYRENQTKGRQISFIVQH